MTTEVEPDTVPADCDERMHSHIVCPKCSPKPWALGMKALCGAGLLGIEADGVKVCPPCKTMWFKHVREMHMGMSNRG